MRSPRKYVEKEREGLRIEPWPGELSELRGDRKKTAGRHEASVGASCRGRVKEEGERFPSPPSNVAGWRWLYENRPGGGPGARAD